MSAPWQTATHAALKKHVGAGKKLLLLIDSSGTNYCGFVKSLGPSYIELNNGPHELTVFYGSRPFRFTTFEAPEGFRFGVKTPELNLE